MRIVRLSPDEGPRLRRLRLRALGADPDAFGSTLEETAARPPESWRQQLADLPTFFAVAEGQDVGMVRVAPAEALVISMWVAPQARGRGVGGALLEAVIAWARAEGVRRLLLDVADENAAAIALYARWGFEPTGETGTLPPPRQHITEHRRARTVS